MNNFQGAQSVSVNNKASELLQRYPVILQILRFGAIGVFNTAMDVLVLNYLSSQFGVTKGIGLGWVNLPGFVLAVIQSYFWNKYWAFGQQEAVNLLKNFVRLVVVGAVAVLVYGLVVLGGHNAAPPVYFLGILIVFILAQLVLWNSFGFFKQNTEGAGKSYLSFFVVSIIGFLINSAVLYAATTHLILSSNSGDNLNMAKILAICFSLIWNFVGYKIFVFKK